jgi:hypothetical protein
MSTTQEGHIAIKIVDYNRVPRSLPFYFKNASGSLDDIQTLGTDLATALDPLIGGQITSIDSVIHQAIPSGLKSGPVQGDDNMVSALLTYYTAQPRAYGFAVPSWKPLAFRPSPSANQVWTDSNGSTVGTLNVVAFLALLLATTAGTQLTDPQFNPLLGLTRAIKSSRSERRGLSRAR